MPRGTTSLVSLASILLNLNTEWSGVGGRTPESRKFGLKIIRKDKLSSDQEKALGTELALIRRLRHRQLLQLVDELDTPAEWYFVMEFFSVRHSVSLLSVEITTWTPGDQGTPGFVV